MNKPLVSVLMTAYNSEKYIVEAIESVLASTYTNFELIIVDDVSKDQTLEIAQGHIKKDSRVKVYVNEQNLGDYPNRNKAASYAQGKYLKYVDADDMLYDYGLEVMVRFTESFPEAGFGLGCYPADDRPFPYLLTPREIYLESFGKSNHFDRAPGSGLIKKEVFDAVGGFSGKRMIGDYEFWFQISRYYSMVKLPLDLYWNRLHSHQESQSEYARKNYPLLRKEILENALTHPDCPLNSEEIKKIREANKKRERKEKISTYLKKASKLIKL
ncbi:MAG: glycosyltransferase family 2 protein [Chitinophagaceae bacterium]